MTSAYLLKRWKHTISIPLGYSENEYGIVLGMHAVCLLTVESYQLYWNLEICYNQTLVVNLQAIWCRIITEYAWVA